MKSRDLVMQIEDALKQLQAMPPQQVESLAKQYAAIVEGVNKRLMDCVLYLRQGFRGEALRLCELEPNLLDEFTILNFPQRSIWIQVAAQMGVSTLELSIVLAKELNSAYDDYQKVRELADEYRWQNAVRANPAERLATLNALAALEPANMMWREAIAQLGKS